jgi:hypothetical protein
MMKAKRAASMTAQARAAFHLGGISLHLVSGSM